MKKMGTQLMKRCRNLFRYTLSFLTVLLILVWVTPESYAGSITVDWGEAGYISAMDSLQLLFIFALLSIGPSLIMMMTCFTRIIIVFSCLRNASGLQQVPPAQVIVGLALFLSLFIMSPVIDQIQTEGLQPYMAQEISEDEALERMITPIKQFMIHQTKTSDINLFLSLAYGGEVPPGMEEVGLNPDALLALPLTVLVPAFITSELSTAFSMGFLIYLPFLVVDVIVSSTLMSMGMMMLPPAMIATPFKLMLFVVVDGWRLITETLVIGYLT